MKIRLTPGNQDFCSTKSNNFLIFIIMISLVGHTNFSCTEVGGVKGGGENAKKFIWPVRVHTDRYN